jgi:predicted oxidoreductase
VPDSDNISSTQKIVYQEAIARSRRIGRSNKKQPRLGVTRRQRIADRDKFTEAFVPGQSADKAHNELVSIKTQPLPHLSAGGLVRKVASSTDAAGATRANDARLAPRD